MRDTLEFYDNVPDRQRVFARLLAGENIHVIQAGTDTARFDMKDRTLILPYWLRVPAEVSDLLVAHECGHAIFTPVIPRTDDKGTTLTNIWRRVLAKIAPNLVVDDTVLRKFADYVNVTEDGRIERKIKAKYKGLPRMFHRGYKILQEDRNFFGLKDEYGQTRDLTTLTLIDRMNLAAKVGHLIGIKLTPQEQAIYNRMQSTETYEQAVKVAAEIFVHAAANKSSASSQPMVTIFGGFGMPGEGAKGTPAAGMEADDTAGSGAGQPGPGKSTGDDDDDSAGDVDGSDGKSGSDTKPDNAKPDNAKPGKGQGDGVAKDDGSGDKPQPSTSDYHRGTFGDGGPKTPVPPDITNREVTQLPAASTVKAAEKALKRMAAEDRHQVDSSESPMSMMFPKLARIREALPKAVVPAKRIAEACHAANTSHRPVLKEIAEDFRRSQSSVISYMAQEFDRKKRADIHARTRTTATGELDMAKLHTYKFNEKLFLQHQIIPKGKKHGLIMLMDWSSSMRPHTAGVMTQILTFALFCRRVKIPFDVYAFTDTGAGRAYAVTDPGSFTVSGVHLLHLLSSVMPDNEFNVMYEWMVMVRGVFGGYKIPGGRTYNDMFKLPGILSQGGTPLFRGLLLMPGLADQFRVRHQVQKLGILVLTDGGDTNGLEFHTTYQMPGTIKRGSGSVHVGDTLQDADTRMWYRAGRSVFSRMIEWIGHKSGAEMLSVHLLDDHFRGLTYAIQAFAADPSAITAVQPEPIKAQAQKTGWAVLPFDTGFDQAYVVRAGVHLQERDLPKVTGTDSTTIANSGAAWQKAKDAPKQLAAHMIDKLA